MGKIMKYLAASTMLAMMLPTVVLAHGDDRGDKDDDRDRILIQRNDRDDDDRDRQRFKTVDLDNLLNANANLKTRVGTVVSVGANSFTLDANGSDSNFTVNTNGDITFHLPFQGSASFSNLQVNAMVKVRGTIDDSTITAKSVVILPPNNHPAAAKGTITSVSGSTLTMQTNGGNTVTVNTNANTSVTKADGSAGTMTDVGVGVMVKIKGLWDAALNVFNAIKIRLF